MLVVMVVVYSLTVCGCASSSSGNAGDNNLTNCGNEGGGWRNGGSRLTAENDDGCGLTDIGSDCNYSFNVGNVGGMSFTAGSDFIYTCNIIAGSGGENSHITCNKILSLSNTLVEVILLLGEIVIIISNFCCSN